MTAVATSAAACASLLEQSKNLPDDQAVALLQEALAYADGRCGVALGAVHVLRVMVLRELFVAQSAGENRRAAIATGMRLQAVLDTVCDEVGHMLGVGMHAAKSAIRCGRGVLS